MRTTRWILGALLLLAFAHGVDAAKQASAKPTSAKPSSDARPAAPKAAARPSRPSGAVVVPDRFVRPWDPVTFFLDRDMGPSGGGPEDRPSRVVTVDPPQPGAYTWLDARTLQFRPADPWPALTRFTWTVTGRKVALSTLMAAPTDTQPADGATDVESPESIALTFREPLDVAALARMVRIELRPFPGISPDGARWIGGDELEIKAVERRDSNDPARYVLLLDEPIASATRVLVHLRLALDDEDEASFATISFTTALPFRVASVGCPGGASVPIGPGGTRLDDDQAMACGGDRVITVRFTSPVGTLTPVEGRDLVRFTPSVEGLEFTAEGSTLRIDGHFEQGRLYHLRLMPTDLADARGRKLDLANESDIPFHFAVASRMLKWRASQGIVERLGPQRVPLEGRGDERVDLRIHRIDPLDRSFWPFPATPIVTDEARRPPGPGEEPGPFTSEDRRIDAGALTEQIAALGSPAVSSLVELPTRGRGSAATFGLDLSPHLARIAGAGKSGSYLVGIRRLDESTTRSWMRVQVTDLCLSTVEEAQAVRFVVSSLSKGGPVAGARVRVEGIHWSGSGHQWQTVFEGATGGDGTLQWTPPGSQPGQSWSVQRLVVTSADDILVLDASMPPETFHDNFWSDDHETWLGWTTQSDLSYRAEQPARLGHLFSERPVYRPEETVHLKAWIRTRLRGALSIEGGTGALVIVGPGNREWRYPTELSATGAFDHAFHEDDEPTGTYEARYDEERNGSTQTICHMSFRVEAYRLPRFEIRLTSPDTVPLDTPFDVKLSASYYAGGGVAGRPIRWRVTQFPHDWTPAAKPGFVFSSDARFSSRAGFTSSPQLEKQDTTDDKGAASLTLDPSIEPTAQPREYAVEATITGDDDQTVTAVERVVALPPFVLGLKVPRYVEHAGDITPSVLVLGAGGKAEAGRVVTVRLLSRQWHSHLQASDFSEGAAKYITDVVDEKIFETTVTSGRDAVPVKLAIPRSGVYVVELESHDKQDRAQVVSADLYAGGDQPVAWQKPANRVFTVSPDKKTYDPGQTANLVLQSPFQSGECLVVVEAPDGNRYEWLSVRGGAATFHVPIDAHFAPRIPVHFVLWRGRVPGTTPVPGATDDPGRPATMAATTWLEVSPVGNRVVMTLDHPKKARPGETIDMRITLKDPQGRPLAGEVTLWLVDQAVLALGKEQRLDPVPDFITKQPSRVSVRDTRNLAFGDIPYAEQPGGDSGDTEAESILDKVTVRKNFTPVPYYEPAIQVGPDGVATVKITLADSLTNFMVRAKVASGAERFGYATGTIAVRLPVIVEPALPRFVRPGDTFVAAAIGRVVEGDGGAGRAEAKLEGLALTGSTKVDVALDPLVPARVEFPVEVSLPPLDAKGEPTRKDVSLTIAIERSADKARDAFQVTLPIRNDRRRVIDDELVDLAAGATAPIPPIVGEARPGTLRRSVTATTHRGLVRMAAGLDLLIRYPYGCTEQRVSQARAEIALRKFRDALQLEGTDEELGRTVEQTQVWIRTVIDGNGLCAYWPGGRGYVCLTAWVLHYLIEARGAGFTIDPALIGQLTSSLERSLRSDWTHFIDGESWLERTWALSALSAAGKFNPAYAAELARKAKNLDLEGEAQVLLAFEQGGESSSAPVKTMAKDLREGIAYRLYEGREIYGGLQDRRASRSGLIIPSETRTLAEMVRALRKMPEDTQRMQLMVDALISLGRGDGWGTTNASAEALLALSELLDPTSPSPATATLEVTIGGKAKTLEMGEGAPLARWTGDSAENGEVKLVASSDPTVTVRLQSSWIPAEDGSHEKATSDGFVVTRELLRINSGGLPPDRHPIESAGSKLPFAVGEVVEDRVQVVCPQERHFVAIVVPLAAGMEPLNPNLATAPPEATPSRGLSTQPTYAAYLDDSVSFFFDTLPAGTHDFAFRTRATFPGSFIQPAALAEMMYDGSIRGTSNGARIEVVREAK